MAQLNDPPRRGLEVAGVGLSLVWVILILVYVLVTPPGSDARTLGLVMTLLMVFLPIALIWAVVITLRSIRELRAEAKRLQATVDAMRSSYVQAQAQGAAEAVGRTEAGRDRRLDQRGPDGAGHLHLAPGCSAVGALGGSQGRARAPGPARNLLPKNRRWRLARPAEDFRPPLSVVRFHPGAAVPRDAGRQGGLPRPAAGAGGPDIVQADPRRAGCADAAEPGRHLHG